MTCSFLPLHLSDFTSETLYSNENCASYVAVVKIIANVNSSQRGHLFHPLLGILLSALWQCIFSGDGDS